VGRPGTKFSYGGGADVLPIEGEIELIADRKPSDYILAGNRLPVDVGPLDAFGMRTVEIPMPEPQPEVTAQVQPQPKAEQVAEAHR
jgi:hypothetical protein